MFEVSVDLSFSAGHALRGYKGKCENVHGHNYRVRVTVAGKQLNSIGLLVDFAEVRSAIRTLVDQLDHRFLNDLPPFNQTNPSAENIAKYFSDEIEPKFRDRECHLKSVTVWETDQSFATYRPAGIS
jgi:6-pyruvoyltetrahydropterin/6-carboxytetrahydropterin synthase